MRPQTMSGWLAGCATTVGYPALCAAYVAALSLMYCRPMLRRCMAIFVQPGRMSLTNYVAQSIVGVGIFYGYGLGLWGRIGPAWSIPIIAAVFGGQALLSSWCLKRFRYGPLEWVWRCVTYGQWLPSRRDRCPPMGEADRIDLRAATVRERT